IEYCCHRVFALYRRYDEYADQQARREWRELLPVPRDRFGVGVLGLGVLGSAIAGTLSGFGYRVRGFARTRHELAGVETFAGDGQWPQFLGGCQVLIVVAPLTPQTQNLLDRRSLSMLPRGAHLINVARGGLIVDQDLLALLDEGHLGGATLDVFRTEPLPADHRFWSHPRIRITPHIAAVTLVEEAASQVARQIDQLERGERPTGLVDRQRGY
ncbi:MAG TPA: NAD(P)-dependent oxidoreductase, partial [Burkholderiaceae bacterium]|nr:NAD(P)-dependent oxidoreductase [Burkholderiaceae bacterium]